MNPSTRKLCVVLGAGGHASVLLEALLLQPSEFEFVVLDSNQNLHGKEMLGVRIVGDDSLIPGLKLQSDTRFVIGIGGTGNTNPRQQLYERALSSGLLPLSVLHPSAICSSTAILGEGVQLLAGCIVSAGAKIGDNSIVNSGAVVEHGCRIESHVHIASSATICGDVFVGEGAHIGAGATIKQGIAIGRGAIVGAGSAVIKDIPAGVVAVGVPARHLDERKK